MKVEEKKPRKVRSDKKHEIKPTVSLKLYDCIARLSFITRTPMKDVAEYFCQAGLNSMETLEVLGPYFKRTYKFKNTLFFGHKDIDTNRNTKIQGPKKRLSLRFKREMDERIENLAYALGTTPSSTVSLLLHTAVQNTNLLNEYITQYVDKNLDPSRRKELEQVYLFIKNKNPYFSKEELTFARFINLIFEEIKEQSVNTSVNVIRSIEKWLDEKVGPTKSGKK